MSQSTKEKLFYSFKDLTMEKPLSKITISNITERVGVNRHTFYYHFKDEKDLMEWGVKRSLEKAMTEASRSGAWIDSLEPVLDMAEKERTFILTIYHSQLKSSIRKVIYGWSLSIFDNIIRNNASGMNIKEQDLQFFVKIITYGVSGIFFDWLEGGMMENRRLLCEQIRCLTGSSFEGELQKFVK